MVKPVFCGKGNILIGLLFLIVAGHFFSYDIFNVSIRNGVAPVGIICKRVFLRGDILIYPELIAPCSVAFAKCAYKELIVALPVIILYKAVVKGI